MDEEFDFVGDYYYGLAPVRVGSKWGIINFSNDLITSIDYDSILEINKDPLSSIITISAIQDGKPIDIITASEYDDKMFDEDGIFIEEDILDDDSYSEDDIHNPWEDEPGWGSYEKYGGPNGYDDFTIDEAFEGDPDAVWNID